MTMDFTGASMNRAGGPSVADERALSRNALPSAASFEIDLQTAQLDSASGGLGLSLPDAPLKDPGISDISEDPSPAEDSSLAEQMMWLGVTLPIPIELCPEGTAAGTEDDSAPLVPSDSNRMTRAPLTHWIKAGPAPVGEPREELAADPRSVSIDPATVDLPTLDPRLRFTPETISPAIISPLSPIEERLLSDSPLDEVRLPLGGQALTQPTVDEGHQSFEAPAPDAEYTVTVDRPMGFVSVHPNEVHTNGPQAATESSPSAVGIPMESRTDLSEVVRQVRTMVTEQETRSMIQLEPAELGRLTVELVDAPEGLRVTVSAEDPAVLRFLERNVLLLESEARLQGVGHMSFSVGANVSGGLGRGDQRQSEAEASFRKSIEMNTALLAKPRSRRELDTSA